MNNQVKTGYPSIDKPWLKYYSQDIIDTPLPDCTLFELIYNRNQDNLERTAIEYYGTSMSYGEMFHAISLLAGTLESKGIKAGDYVTVCMINSPETICLLFALNKIGAVANMVYGTSTLQELKRYIQDTNTKVVFTLDIYQDKFVQIAAEAKIDQIIVTSLARSMSSDERKTLGDLGIEQRALPDNERFITWERYFNGSAESSFIFGNSNAPAVVTYTGGTTGGSKGAIFTNKAIIAATTQYISCVQNLNRDDTWILTLPLFIAFGVTCSMTIPLIVGMTMIVRLPLMETMTDLCKRFRANHIMHGPAYWEELASSNQKIDLSGLLTPLSGGDILRPAVESKINEYLMKCGCMVPILNAYGLTENCAVGCANFRFAHKLGSIGIPFAKNIISTFHTESGEELQYNQEGEICINAPSAMSGYVNNSEETKHILRLHDDGRVWIHTGDLGYIDEDGFVYVSGRLKRYMNCVSGGVHKKVFSLDIEKVLLKHPSVEKCAIVPVSSPETIQAPAAFVVLKKGAPDHAVSESELTEYVEEMLDPIYRPIRYYFVDSFPLTKVGKVDYRALEQEAERRQNEESQRN